MAKKRMFSQQITESDAFLDMPLSAQALYFHLGMNADDDGFVNSPKRIQRVIGANDDDLKLLIAKRFIIAFESGVVVIKHWKINNYIQKDRYTPTVYVEEKALLVEKPNKAYMVMDTECIHGVYKLDTQTRLDKNRLDKNSCSSGEWTNVWQVLTADQVDNLYEVYADAGDLIQAVYEQVRLKQTVLQNAYAYVIGYAEKIGWQKNGGDY